MAKLPVIPEYITVHLGPPDSDAANVTVSFSDYIKNVASSEIYPTWPENAIRANIYAQISFALNKIYTEFYRSRGYDFDITNSTSTDQAFVYGRDIFENISQIVDDIFNDYVRRQGTVEPLFTEYCNGTTVTCNGLSQWGTVDLANQGYTPYEILQYYYGDDIDIVTNTPVEGITESVPDRLLREGLVGNDVRQIQVRLNRIAKNYPAIPKIENADGVFGADTDAAVREFQKIFNLTPDGIVGRGTWYKIQLVYNAVKRISELDSEGIPLEDVTDLFKEPLSIGDTGVQIRELQYFLEFISNYEPTVPPINIDGIFGPRTEEAVRAFQRQYGLPETGEVNAATWDRLYRAYRGIIQSLPDGYLDGTTVPYPGNPIRLGSRGENVAVIQEYLNFISQTYTEIPKLVVDGVFGAATENAVKIFQRLFGIEPTGIVGALTWSEIANLYRSLLDGSMRSKGQYPGYTVG